MGMLYRKRRYSRCELVILICTLCFWFGSSFSAVCLLALVLCSVPDIDLARVQSYLVAGDNGAEITLPIATGVYVGRTY